MIIASGALVAATLPLSSAAAATPADIVLRIRVTDAAGMPQAGATVLTTVLWASKSDYRRFGRPRATLLHAGDQGELTVPIRLDRQQRASVRRNGDWAGISVVAFDAAGVPASSATTSRYIGPRPDKREQARTMPHAEVVRLVQASGAKAGAAPGAGANAGAATATQNDAAPALAASTPDCPYYYWDADSYWNRYAQVGELHVDEDVTNARFTYGATADTTFDVAQKAGTGDWTVVGAVHIENSRDTAVFAETEGQTNYHNALRTQFRFVNMKLFKDCVGGPYRVWTGTQMAYALEWTGNGMTISNSITQPARKSANSATYGPRTGWVRTSGALVRWSAAVSAWGALLSSQSGSSAYVKIEYSFGPRQTHYLYGDTGLPSVSKRVFQDTP